MSTSSESLHHLVPTYRRDTDEVIGAVRRSSVEFIGMEQMPGGKFQITARTASGAETFVSAVTTSLRAGHAALDAARRSFGGEDPKPEDGQQGQHATDATFVSLTESLALSNAPLLQASPGIDAQPPKEPRRPAFAFAEIDVPELPTSVR